MTDDGNVAPGADRGSGLLLAEELLLLFLDDETGACRVDGTSADYALAGAVLTELALAERVRITDRKGWRHPARVEVTEPSAFGDTVLDGALDRIGEKAQTADSLVPQLSKRLRGELLERLTRRELVRHEEGRVFAIFPQHRYPAVGGQVEQDIRRRVRAVLLGEATPDLRTAALVGLLSAVDHAHKVIGELDRDTTKQVRGRAKQIAEGEWVPAAVRSAVQASQAAVGAAVIASTTAATIASI